MLREFVVIMVRLCWKLAHGAISKVRGICVHTVGLTTWCLAHWVWGHRDVTLARSMGMKFFCQPGSMSSKGSLWVCFSGPWHRTSFLASLEAYLPKWPIGLFLRPDIWAQAGSAGPGVCLLAVSLWGCFSSSEYNHMLSWLVWVHVLLWVAYSARTQAQKTGARNTGTQMFSQPGYVSFRGNLQDCKSGLECERKAVWLTSYCVC